MLSKEGNAVECQLIGVWGTWEAWSSCPINPPIPLMNIRRRLRDCIPQPPNCTEIVQYNCNGPYSEVVNCAVSTTTSSTSTTTTLPTTTTTAIPTTSTTTTTTSTTITTPFPTSTSTTTQTPTPTVTTTTSTTTSTSTTTTTTTTSPTTTTTTTPRPTTVTATTAIQVLPTEAGDPACAGTQWNTWLEWSECTDTCGACGTHQRFRACTKAAPTCKCTGTAIEKTPCNPMVCKYPRATPCCGNYSPFSQDGDFVCLQNSK